MIFALIFGVANKNSIAWGITQKLHEEGATIALSYAGEIMEKRVFPLAKEINCDFVEPCDVTSDADLDTLFELSTRIAVVAAMAPLASLNCTAPT